MGHTCCGRSAFALGFIALGVGVLVALNVVSEARNILAQALPGFAACERHGPKSEDGDEGDVDGFACHGVSRFGMVGAAW